MAEIKKYKLKKNIGGIAYGKSGNKPVQYKTGDIVYGVIYYEGGDLVWVNTSGNFDGNDPTLAISLAYLQTTDGDVDPNTGNVTENTNENQTETEVKSAFWNQKYEISLVKLYAGSIGIWFFGYLIGAWIHKTKK